MLPFPDLHIKNEIQREEIRSSEHSLEMMSASLLLFYLDTTIVLFPHTFLLNFSSSGLSISNAARVHGLGWSRGFAMDQNQKTAASLPKLGLSIKEQKLIKFKESKLGNQS